MKKLVSGSRATFVSPYLRRPLRPLDKVLSERADGRDEGGAEYGVEELADEARSATWGFARKR